jgi:hypothetical protein
MIKRYEKVNNSNLEGVICIVIFCSNCNIFLHYITNTLKTILFSFIEKKMEEGTPLFFYCSWLAYFKPTNTNNQNRVYFLGS